MIAFAPREKRLHRVSDAHPEILPLGDLAASEQGAHRRAILAHYAGDKFRYSSAWLGPLEKQMKAGELPSLSKYEVAV
ncbi:MAG TPA: hypothetical protein VF085_00560 [Solirubrobacterales bacterium]